MKKIIGFILILSTVLVFIPTSVFAAPDPVQTAYDAYIELKLSLENKDLDDFKTSYQAYKDATEVLDSEQFNELMQKDSGILTLLLDCLTISQTANMYEGFVNDKNAATAEPLVQNYEYHFKNGEPSAIALLILDMIPDLEDAYQEALSYKPSDDVFVVYDAFIPVQSALNGSSIDDLSTAVDDFYDVIDIFNELNYSDMSYLATLLGVYDAEDAWDTVFSTWVNANIILETESSYSEFLNNSNLETAHKFAVTYENIFKDPEFTDEYLKVLVRIFLSDIDDVYEDALTYVPSDNIYAVYNSFMDVRSALANNSTDDLRTAVDNFYDVVDIFNNFDEDELNNLAVLMGEEDAEGVWTAVFCDWVNANIILETDDLYNDYLENPNKKTAKAFTEYYDTIFNDPDYVDEELKDLVRAFFESIDDDYNEALELLNDNSDKPTGSGTDASTPEPTKKPDSTKKPASSNKSNQSKKPVSVDKSDVPEDVVAEEVTEEITATEETTTTEETTVSVKATEEITESTEKDYPQEEKSSDLWIWIVVIVALGGCLVGFTVYFKRK